MTEGKALESQKIGIGEIDEESFTDLMGFSSFGKIRYKKKNYNRLIESSKTQLAPKPAPKPLTKPISSDESDVESVEEVPETDYTDPENRIPCSNALNIDNSKKLVNFTYRQISTIAIDTSGSRMLIAGFDCNCKMYDFATMDSKFQPFRTFKPIEDVPIRAMKYSPACDLVLVYGNTNALKLLNRDGKLMCECLRGDRYIADKIQTKGHVSEVNSAAWNPIDLDYLISCGMDYTIRLWNVETADFGCKRVLKLKTRNKNSPCIEILYNGSGTIWYGSCLDGSINIWDPKKPTADPVSTIPDAHRNGGAAYSLALSRDGNYIVSRGFDETLKLWDFRNFKKPTHSISLPNCYDATRVVYTPDYKLIMTGTSINRGSEKCELHFYSADDLTLRKTIPFDDKSTPITPVWHPKLNQLFVGCSNGNVKTFFDPERSLKGILLCMDKIHKVKYDEGEDLLHEQVFTPYSKDDGLDMVNVNVRKLQIKARRDPFMTRKPEPPVYGPGQGGRVTTAMSLAAFVCKSMIPLSPPREDSNPRESILKYSQLAEEEPYFVAPAYAKTQPVPIFHDPKLDIVDDDDIIKKKKTL